MSEETKTKCPRCGSDLRPLSVSTGQKKHESLMECMGGCGVIMPELIDRYIYATNLKKELNSLPVGTNYFRVYVSKALMYIIEELETIRKRVEDHTHYTGSL